jgi:2'-5' RNA ligase
VEETQRLFIAIDLSPDVRRWLEKARSVLEPGMPAGAVRWVDPRGTHITIKFLGEVAKSRIEGLRAAMDLSVEESGILELTVDGLGCFPNTARPRVVWAGIRPQPKLASLQQRLEDRLDAAGFERERRAFSPHLTLGRVKDGVAESQLRRIGAAVESARMEPPVEMTADSFSLFRSVLRPSGPEYTALYRTELSARRPSFPGR